MAIIEGFDEYKSGPERFLGNTNKSGFSCERRLPRRPWWKRLFTKRPAGQVYVTFSFAPTKAGGEIEWQCAEAMVHYPPGVEKIKLQIDTFLNGNSKPIYFDPENIALASFDK